MNNIEVKQKDQTVPNVIFCSALVLLESLQALIVLVVIFSFIPFPASPSLAHLFARQMAEVLPEREMFFYHAFVAMVILGQITILFVYRRKLSSASLVRQWRAFLCVEAGWLFLMVFAAFKFFVYGYVDWAKHLLYVVIALSILSKIFWKEVKTSAVCTFGYLLNNSSKVAKAMRIVFPLFVILLIFVPDRHGVVARMWIGDASIHTDTCLLAQAWAYTKGVKLNVDIFSPYGVGMVAFISHIAKVLGGLSYEMTMGILMTAAIAYFILCFFFLRHWLRSTCLAMAGVLLAIKWQMFHQGNYPLVFTYPLATVARYWFDIVVLCLLLAHVRRGQLYLLVIAGGVCGLATAYITDTGVYLTMAYVFYLIWWAFEQIIHEQKAIKDILRTALVCAATVFTSALLWFYAFVGAHVFSRVFWKNMMERADYFFIGHGNLPMYKSLLEGDHSSTLMGFLMPLVYCGVLLAVVALRYFRKIDREHIMAAVLCVYGLGLYHYYVVRSANTSYDSVCVPFVFVLCWIARIAIGCLAARLRPMAAGALLAGSAFALLTTHSFLSYSNFFNLSSNPVVAPAVKWPNKNLPYYFNNTPKRYPEHFKLSANSLGGTDEDLRTEADFKSDKELKEYFDREFDFKEDAALIDRLTAPGDAVALISSFETRILMQADRKPFFYYFPLILSRPMNMRMFGFSILWTSDQLAVIMKQLEQSKPEHVFMERVFLTNQVPQSYTFLFPEVIYILNYLNKNYKPDQFGKYLVALKRID